MSESSRNPFITLFHIITKPFIWLANFTRHALLLILLVVMVSFWIDFGPELNPNSALVLAPKGYVVEQYSGDAVSQALGNLQNNRIPETRIRDLVRAVELAAKDSHISALVINSDYMWGAGLAHLRELGRAIERFKKESNKPVIAIASNLSQSQYYLATLADEIIMDPQGFLFIQGFGSYRNYFKDGLDKLGVDVHLFKVGEYKSAAEPYVRNDMSQEAKEAGLHYMNDLWETYLSDIASRRGLTVEDLTTYVDEQAQRLMEKDGSVADMAMSSGLVDFVKKRSFMHKHVAEKSSFDDDNIRFRGIDFEDYLTLDDDQSDQFLKDQVAVVVAEGAIMSGQQEPGVIGGDSTSALLQAARTTPSVKAVVLRVNSPGGGVYPSEQIRREVEQLKIAGKPVVVSMGNVAASGGYWISMSANSIWADEATITGSIGIYGLLMNYPKLFNKLGISTDGVGTTKWIGAFDPSKDLDEEFAQLIQSNIEYGYQQFIGSVAAARNLEVEMVDRIARGRVWTAKQGKDLGLIDHMGGLSEAIADAAQQAQLNRYGVQWVEETMSFKDQLMVDMLAKAAEFLPQNSRMKPSLEAYLAPIQAQLAVILGNQQNGVAQLAHCQCEWQLK